MTDDLRKVLGERTFQELSQLGHEFEEESFDHMGRNLVELLGDVHFTAKIPIVGSDALMLVAAFVHLIETGCDNCREQVEDFTANFITSLWELLQQAYADMEDFRE